MINKSLSLVLVAAVVANSVAICLGHSHGSIDAPGQASHIHLFGHGHHDHGHHDHGHHDHGHHEGVDDLEAIGYSVSDSGPKIGQRNTEHNSDAVYLVDLDLQSTKDRDDTDGKNENVVFFVSSQAPKSASPSSLARLIGPKKLVFARAHFLNTVRLLL